MLCYYWDLSVFQLCCFSFIYFETILRCTNFLDSVNILVIQPCHVHVSDIQDWQLIKFFQLKSIITKYWSSKSLVSLIFPLKYTVSNFNVSILIFLNWMVFVWCVQLLIHREVYFVFTLSYDFYLSAFFCLFIFYL